MTVALTILLFLFTSQLQTLNGTVLDSAGGAVAGARVEITGPGSPRAASTNEAGAFSIDAIPAGRYSIRITANGFAPYDGSIQVPSEAIQLTLQVAPHS